jgi:hypothetical protein
MGILLNVPDTAQYLSWARESEHAIFIQNKLTAEPGDPVYFNLFWFVVGRLAVATGQPLAAMTQVARLFAGLVLLASLYWFVTLVEKRPLHRRIAFLTVALGGGLGWGLVVLKQFSGRLDFPLDLYVTEPNSFLTVLAFPHQAMAGGLLVLILCLAALAFERESFRLALGAGALTVVLGVQHGYDLLIVYAVVGVVALYLGWKTRRLPLYLGLASAIGVWSVPSALYLVYLTRQSPIWRGVLAQYGNAGVFTPSPTHLVVLLGLPLLVLVATRGDTNLNTTMPAREVLLRGWLVVGAILLYIPTNFQIKMLADWQVPVGILATRIVLDQGSRWINQRQWSNPRWTGVALGVLLVAAVLPTNVYLFSWRLVDLGRHEYPYYLRNDDITALRWLEANTSPADVVLSGLTIGQYVPSVSGNSAFLAHWAETLDYYTKTRLVSQFFAASTSDEERRDALRRYGVQYVYVGTEERSLGRFDPEQTALLQRVFADSTVAIYRVTVDVVRGAP